MFFEGQTMAKKITITTAAIFIFFGFALTNTTVHEASPIPSENIIILHGKASWYSEQSPGINRHTANNEVFDDQDLTCAMWTVPFNQLIRVTNLENGKSVTVRVNDRGPHSRFVRQGRVIDLTKAAFQEISGLKKGIIRVQLEFL
jgi:rare lipoprotein A